MKPSFYSFAFDFWKSKTTHLALITVGASLYAYVKNHIPVDHALLPVIVSLGIAFLRDAHVKSLHDVADLLQEISSASQSDPDVDADAPLAVGA